MCSTCMHLCLCLQCMWGGGVLHQGVAGPWVEEARGCSAAAGMEVGSHLSVHTSHLSERTSHLSVRTSHLSERTSHLSVRTSHLSVRTSHLSVRTSHLSVRTSHGASLSAKGKPESQKPTLNPVAHCSKPCSSSLST